MFGYRMKKMISFFGWLILMLWAAGSSAQEDWSWWNDTHGWEPGMPGWRNWLIISPGYLGPNALPVPDVKTGILEQHSELRATMSSHFMKEDPTQDISGYCYLPFAEGKIAIEMYGVLLEHYAFSERVRDERFARDRDGKGIAVGDFYFSTLVQIFKNRKFPNTVFRAALKTASGGKLEAARYADAPGYFLDFSFSKDKHLRKGGWVRPFCMLGFYSWQTNDELNLQNDALLYGAGLQLNSSTHWQYVASWSGYFGYKNNGDRPMQLNFSLRKDFDVHALRLEYRHGLHDWLYRTVSVSYIWKFPGIK